MGCRRAGARSGPPGGAIPTCNSAKRLGESVCNLIHTVDVASGVNLCPRCFTFRTCIERQGRV